MIEFVRHLVEGEGGWRAVRENFQRLKWAIALDRIDAAGGSLESATEQTDATPSGRFARGMLGEMNAYQAELIGETWREAHDRRRRNGLTPTGGQRYGYERVDGAYVPHPIEGPVLAEMYRRAANGEGFLSIARWANRNNHLTRAGRPWSRSTVRTLLDSGFGAGKIVQQGMVGGKRTTNVDAHTYHPGAHEPVAVEDLWERYLERRRSAHDDQAHHIAHMLSGLVLCAECGSAMHNSRNQRADHYRCTRALETGVGRAVSMTRHLVEQLVTEWLMELPANLEEVARAHAERERARVRTIDDRAAIDSLLRRNQERQVKLTVDHLDGKIPEVAYQATVLELERERLALEERRARSETPPRVLDPRKLVLPLADEWRRMPPQAQNRVLRGLVSAVLIKVPARQGKGVWRERVAIVGRWEERDGEW